LEKTFFGQTKPMGVIGGWCRQSIGKQLALMDLGMLALAQARTSISINKYAAP
jgi:hypothetical protein